MDTSETYIKMCERARELQYHKWQLGFSEGDYVYENVVRSGKEHIHVLGHDYVALKTYFERGYGFVKYALLEKLEAKPIFENTLDRVTIKEGEYGFYTTGQCIWLPRQDQLQEMVKPLYEEHWGKEIVSGLMQEAITITFGGYTPESMEQLWLAFVMKEKYEKIWNGTEWAIN